MLEYTLIVLLLVWAVCCLYHRFRDRLRGGDCGCACCEDCASAKDAEKRGCCSTGWKEERKKN